MDEVRASLLRRLQAAEARIDRVKVFGRAYNQACDEVEDVEEQLGELTTDDLKFLAT